jgi:hypothetical protein
MALSNITSMLSLSALIPIPSSSRKVFSVPSLAATRQVTSQQMTICFTFVVCFLGLFQFKISYVSFIFLGCASAAGDDIVFWLNEMMWLANSFFGHYFYWD